MKLKIEGWRGINHSYAMVNQYQILALKRRENISLFHEDAPFFSPVWNTNRNSSGFTEQELELILQLTNCSNEACDVTYRISGPFRLYGSESKKLFVYGNSEWQYISDDQIYQGNEANKIYSCNEINIVTPSNWSKEGFLKYGFKPECVFVVPHGVDTKKFYPLGRSEICCIRKAFGWKNEDFVFLNVGAMTANKGIDSLILAFAYVNSKYPFTRLVLKDQSNLYRPSASSVLSEAKRRHADLITDNVIRSIIGISDNLGLEELCKLYNAADAYVSPYRAEGFNLTPLEAGACGIPVLITGGGATDDYFHESYATRISGKKMTNGIKTWIEPDLDNLIASMECLIEKNNPLINLSYSVPWIETHFSWETVTSQLVGVFENS